MPLLSCDPSCCCPCGVPLARRLVPHALLGLLVLAQPGAFASWAYYLLAAGGMAYMNAVNAYRALDLLAPVPAGKAHVA